MSGGYVSEVIAEALSMAESNACMRRIVAAPTAGACGVLPAVLLPMCKYEELSQHRILEALYVASRYRRGDRLPGLHRRRLRRLSGGDRHRLPPWRREPWWPCGTAPAEQIGHAVAMALKNLMGLVCDPVAGLVEVPCVKRNVIGAVNAVSAADMALAGIESRIPVDEVIDAMGEVGRRMPVEFRENRPGRPGRHPHRPPGQAADAPGVPGILIPVRSIFLKNNNPYTKDIPDAWHRGCLSLSKKPRGVCRPQAANQLRSFSSGACTWTEILLRSRPGRWRPCR